MNLICGGRSSIIVYIGMLLSKVVKNDRRGVVL